MGQDPRGAQEEKEGEGQGGIIEILVKVVPRASRDRIVGWLGGRLKVSVTAPPERGKANEAVVELLAAALAVPRASVRVTSGFTSPLKTLSLDVPDPDAALRRLPPR